MFSSLDFCCFWFCLFFSFIFSFAPCSYKFVSLVWGRIFFLFLDFFTFLLFCFVITSTFFFIRFFSSMFVSLFPRLWCVRFSSYFCFSFTLSVIIFSFYCFVFIKISTSFAIFSRLCLSVLSCLWRFLFFFIYFCFLLLPSAICIYFSYTSAYFLVVVCLFPYFFCCTVIHLFTSFFLYLFFCNSIHIFISLYFFFYFSVTSRLRPAKPLYLSSRSSPLVTLYSSLRPCVAACYMLLFPLRLFLPHFVFIGHFHFHSNFFFFLSPFLSLFLSPCRAIFVFIATYCRVFCLRCFLLLFLVCFSFYLGVIYLRVAKE